ncbi:MAG: amino acid permease, partial [Deltaproteobacteria bacterium]
MLNVFGVRGASTAVNLLTVAKLVPLLIFVGVGLFFVDPDRVAFHALPELGSLRQAALLLVFAYGIAAVLAALVVACFAEAGSRSEDTGGPYLYARAAFGDFAGFLVGWMFMLSRLAATAAVANAFVDYLGYIDPVLAHGAARAAAITLV